MTPHELKNSILQLAIQGKLVKQRPDEGTAEKLYQQIQVKRQKLIKVGKMKKGKPLPQMTNNDIPFDIPESWKWVRLSELGAIVGGGTPKTENAEYWDNAGVPWLTPADMKFIIGKYAKHGKRNISTIGLEKSSAQLMPKGTVLYSSRAPIGYIAIAANDISTNQGFKSLVPAVIELNEFMYYCLMARTNDIVSRASGTTFKEISGTDFGLTIVPLPPLAEQKRIVAKIEELLPYINRYEQAWSKLEDFNKRFPTDMQKSILQMAIQGKLVEQRLEEGTGEKLYQQIQVEKQRLIKAGAIKKQKPLPEIAEDEKPFDIPESWKWVRIGSLMNKLVDGTHRTPRYTSSGIPFISVKNISSGKLDISSTKFISKKEHEELWARCNPERGDILLSKIGTTGVPAIVDTDIEFSLFVSVALLKFNKSLINNQFLVYAILSPDFQRQCNLHTRGVGNKNWVIKDIANTVFPLPPLAEQKRIVSKLEQILPLCENLK